MVVVTVVNTTSKYKSDISYFRRVNVRASVRNLDLVLLHESANQTFFYHFGEQE